MEILQAPNKILKQKSLPVEKNDSQLKELIEEMKFKLRLNGVGIAAVQLGILKRVIAFKNGDEIKIIINPEIAKRSEQTCKWIEGCLSLNYGNVQVEMTRNKIVKVKGYNEDWTPYSIKAHDLTSIILQHEIDHLDGKTIWEHTI